MIEPKAERTADELPIEQALARTLGRIRPSDGGSERFALADPDDDVVHVVEVGRSDRPSHVTTVASDDLDDLPDGEGGDVASDGGDVASEESGTPRAESGGDRTTSESTPGTGRGGF